MVYRGRVENGVVILEQGARLREGMDVHVQPVPEHSHVPDDVSTGRELPIAAEFEAFEIEDMAYRKMLPDLLRTSPGKFVAISGGQKIDEDADIGLLGRRTAQHLPDRFVLIRRVDPNFDAPEYLDSPEISY